MTQEVTTGYAPVNGLQMYWDSRGEGGTPLVVTHGGFGLTTMFGDLLDRLAADRQVIAVELQGHGHTKDIDRPFRYETFGDDLAALVEHLGLGQVDLLGYSLGGGASLRATIQHPEVVRRLAVISFAARHDGDFPEVRRAMTYVNRSGFDQMSQSPMYAAWAAVAPDVEAFPTLMDKTGALITGEYDWSAQIRGITAPTLLVFGDADSISPAHAAEFFALLGGGLKDAGWDQADLGRSRLAILPGATHYDIVTSPRMGDVVAEFLA